MVFTSRNMKKGAKHLWTCVAICWFASVVSSDQMKRAKLKSIKDADESHIDNEQKYPRQEVSPHMCLNYLASYSYIPIVHS